MPYQPYQPYNPYQRRQPALQGLDDSIMTPVDRLTQQDAAEMLQEGPMQANNAVALAGLRDQRKRELEQSLMSGATDPYQATQTNRLGVLNRDIAADPFTGTAEQGRVTALQDLLRGTQLQGFDSPQAAAQYGRAQEARKVGMPLDVARLTGELDIEQEKERQRGTLDVARSYQDAQQQQIEALRGGGGLEPGGRVSTSRSGFSITTPTEQQLSPAIANQLDRARQQAAQSSRNQPMLDQQIASTFMAHPASDDVKMTVRAIVADPRARSMSTQQILERLASLGNDVSPQDQVHISELLDIVRGRMF